MKKTLKNELDAVSKICLDATEKVAIEADKLAAAKKAEAEVWGDRSLTLDGKQAAAAARAKDVFAIEERIAAIRKQMRQDVLAVRKRVESDYDNFFNARPEEYDARMADWITSGAASDRELLAVSQRKSTSRTMKRMIGKQLEKSHDENIAFQGRVLQQLADRPDLLAVDQLLEVANMATGGGRSRAEGAPTLHGGTSGATTAGAFVRNWGYVTNDIIKAAPELGFSISATGEKSYFEGEAPNNG